MHAHMYTPLTSTFRFRQYSCGRECYGMRPTRVKCGLERSEGGAGVVRGVVGNLKTDGSMASLPLIERVLSIFKL